jgi:hypothetical protein
MQKFRGRLFWIRRVEILLLTALISFILVASPLVVTQASAAAPKLGGACSKVVHLIGDKD